MIVGSISENLEFEKRVAITPDIVKKYKSLGIQVCLNKNYASHLGIFDKDYLNEGAEVLENEIDVLSRSNIIVQLNMLQEDKSSKLKKDQSLIGVLRVNGPVPSI